MDEASHEIVRPQPANTEKVIKKPSLPMPGGRIGFREFDNPQASEAVNRWTDALKGDTFGFPSMRDPDFVEGFIAKIDNPEEQLKYVLNTRDFLSGKDNSFDPKYVLMFRRTLPASEPKPEHHWTSNYTAVRTGLKEEIVGAHRLHTVILCTTLEDVLSDSGISKKPNYAETDGEIKVDTPSYDQKRALFNFRPKEQEADLQKYMQVQDALSLEQVTAEIKKHKSEMKK